MVKAWAPLSILLALVGLMIISLDRQQRDLPSPLIDQPAPTFSLPALLAQQTMISPRDYIGQRWIVNVWASWCSACQQEHPLLLRFAEQHRVVLVGLNYKDEQAHALQWLAQHGNPYSVVALDQAGQAGLDWGVYGVPETFLIDEQGIIRFKQTGVLTQQVIDEVIQPFIQGQN